MKMAKKWKKRKRRRKKKKRSKMFLWEFGTVSTQGRRKTLRKNDMKEKNGREKENSIYFILL